MTDTGHVVNQYADEIFSLGTELAQIVKAEQSGAPVSLNVGIVNSIAKLITYRILEPALNPNDPIKVTCIEGELETLLASLAVHRLDIVLSDRPIPHGLNVRAYNHSLGESSIAFFARSDLATRYINDFPQSLNDAPMLMPVTRNAIRRALDDWLDRHDINPRVVAEFDDSGLMKAFGEAGAGIFAAPAAIAKQVCESYGVTKIGEAPELKETYFAISPERRLKHPAVVHITESARSGLFN